MSNSITQTIQKENRISRSVQLFFKRFSISSALKASNAYKKKGIPVLSVFEYLFLLAFSNRSLYMSLVTERNAPAFAKDILYRFMKSPQIHIYGKRWDIEVFFKVCKSYLKLGKECRSLSYDAMTAHTAVVFVRYMMLSLERREDQDKRSFGELFLLIYDELSDITWVEAFQHLVEMFDALFCKHTTLCEEHIEELLHTFIDALPAFIKLFFEPIPRQNLDN